MDLEITNSCNAEACTINVTGEIDVSNADSLRDALKELFENSSARDIYIDMTNAPYIDSTGIGVLMGGAHQAKDAGKTLHVICPHANILRVFEMLGVDKELDVKREA